VARPSREQLRKAQIWCKPAVAAGVASDVVFPDPAVKNSTVPKN